MNTPSSASALRVLGSEYLEIGSESEATILRYERERANRMLSFEEIDDLLRVVPTEQRDLVICELARIDLERRFDASPETIESRRCISSFVEHYGDTFSKDRWRSEIAFEHFRLAEQGEGKVSRSECASMYGVDSVRWKSASASEADKTIRYPMPGEVFCSYPLLAELGRGAIARVFLARQPDLAERLVVLKVTERKTLEADNLAGCAADEKKSASNPGSSRFASQIATVPALTTSRTTACPE